MRICFLKDHVKEIHPRTDGIVNITCEGDQHLSIDALSGIVSFLLTKFSYVVF